MQRSGWLSKYRSEIKQQELRDFIICNVIPDFISYSMLDDLKSYVETEKEERGEIGAFCDYYELGNWFENALEECEFDIHEFYNDYQEEIEYRSDR